MTAHEAGARKFWATDCGVFLRPIPALAPQKLRECLPLRLRAHAGTAGFLAAVREFAEEVASWREDLSVETCDATRDKIVAFNAAARRMKAALAPLQSESAAFKLLDVQAWYLLFRAREVDQPIEGRPVVPNLDTDAIDLAHMLQRMHDDLAAIQVLCDYTAKRVTPERSPPKNDERRLISATVEHYRRHFSKLPPQRSWFGDDFMPYVGKCVGLDIGHRIVGEEVAKAAKS